jgi:hypothetical protein
LSASTTRIMPGHECFSRRVLHFARMFGHTRGGGIHRLTSAPTSPIFRHTTK